MALIVDGMPCPLCGKPMRDADCLFATSALDIGALDLMDFIDAAMHWDCYANWEHQKRFARLYFAAERVRASGNSEWGTALDHDEVLVTVNPRKLIAAIHVEIAAIGSGMRVPLPDWEEWLSEEQDWNHALEREAVLAIRPMLRSTLATSEAVVKAAGMEDIAGAVPDEDDELAGIMESFACADLAERAAKKGLKCPGCGEFRKDFEWIDMDHEQIGPNARLACPGCKTEFGPLDM